MFPWLLSNWHQFPEWRLLEGGGDTGSILPPLTVNLLNGGQTNATFNFAGALLGRNRLRVVCTGGGDDTHRKSFTELSTLFDECPTIRKQVDTKINKYKSEVLLRCSWRYTPTVWHNWHDHHRHQKEALCYVLVIALNEILDWQVLRREYSYRYRSGKKSGIEC